MRVPRSIALVAAATAALAGGGSGGALAPAASVHYASDSALATFAKRHRTCDPNYRGRCLRPHAYDYDCAGGSGDGPRYVSGPFRVVGTDHYRLDADRDGTACES